MKLKAYFPLFFMLLALPLLNGCAETAGNRADNSTMIGTTGGDPLAGTLIGRTEAGAGNSAISPAQVTLSEPVWK